MKKVAKQTNYVTVPMFEKHQDFMGKQFKKVFDKLDQNEKDHEKIFEKLDQHSQILDQHSQILNQHSEVLKVMLKEMQEYRNENKIK